MGQTHQILLIDDNPADQVFFSTAIEDSGYPVEIRWIRDGEEALNYFRDQGNLNAPSSLPQLIFLDMNLPPISGAEILEAIKNKEASKDIPVILVSAADIPDNQKSFLNFEAVEFMIKPMDLFELSNNVKRILSDWL